MGGEVSVSGYVRGIDRQQAVLFPETLDDYVGAENPVRVIDAFVDQLDLAALGFQRATPSDLGRPAYDPRALLKLYVYGYLNRTRSSRRLERETHRNVEVMWLVGRTTPDHKTIADFRAAHPTALRGVFREFTVVCRRLSLFGAELVGIDGSKFRAVNAKERSFTAKELRALLGRIDARITEYLTTLEAADRGDPPAPVEAVTPPALQDTVAQLTARQTEYRKLLTSLEETGATQVTLSDPESRRMKTKEGTNVCYNTQIAVDAKHHLLAAVDVTNEINDEHQLAPMAQQAKTTLGVDHLEVTADAGYHHGPSVQACVTAGITPTVPSFNSSKNGPAGRFTKADFTYVPEADAYRCPGDALLPFHFEHQRHGQTQRFYYDFAACTGCPLRTKCTGETQPTRGRRIMRVAHETLLNEMADRVRAHPERMVQRKSLVEHPFGTIKRGHDGGYFLLRGLEKVRGEFSLMGLAYNLIRAINVVGVPTLLATLSPTTRTDVCPAGA